MIQGTDRREKAREMWSRGVSVAEIAKSLDCSRQLVYQWAKDAGWPKRSNGDCMSRAAAEALMDRVVPMEGGPYRCALRLRALAEIALAGSSDYWGSIDGVVVPIVLRWYEPPRYWGGRPNKLIGEYGLCGDYYQFTWLGAA